MSRLIPVSSSASTTPVMANGMAIMMMNGLLNDSNCEAMTIYTSIRISRANSPMSPNIFCWSS